MSNAAERPIVLLAEDHADTRMFYAELFGATFNVVEAGRGDKALELARQQRPSIIVTDLSLPGMSGLDLAKALKADPATQTIPILCLSGHGDAETERAVKASGIDRLLLKPCMPDDLLRHVNELLSDASGNGDAAT